MSLQHRHDRETEQKLWNLLSDTGWVYEITYPWAPGCSSLSGKYPRGSYEQAWNEGQAHVLNAARAGVYVSLRVLPYEQPALPTAIVPKAD